MAILLRGQIELGVQEGEIHISPYVPEQLGPNSYDVRLGPVLKIYTSEVLDVKQKNPVQDITIPPEGFVLQPGTLYLGSTLEEIGSEHHVPMYEGRSSMARLGIQSHISAGFGDIGFKKQWTLEIIVQIPIRIYPHMRIGQVYFLTVNPEFNVIGDRYKGKYNNQSGAQESKSYLDF